MINASDPITEDRAKPEVKGIRDELIDPETIHFWLLCADLLIYVNWFSTFLQKKNLVYSQIANQFKNLKLCYFCICARWAFVYKTGKATFKSLINRCHWGKGIAILMTKDEISMRFKMG